jgi:ribosomal protein S13
MPPQPNFTPKQAKAISSANTASAIADIVGIGTSIATTIASVEDARKREMFQQNLAVLSNEQQITLAKAINNANSETERLSIISQALTNISSQRIANLQNVVTEQERKKRTETILYASGIIVVLGVLIYVIAKKS